MDYGDEFFFLISSCKYDTVCLATSKKIWVVLIVLVGIALECRLMIMVSQAAGCCGWWWWLGERDGDLRGGDIHERALQRDTRE